jgi:very-short-patch-repair endonuclease
MSEFEKITEQDHEEFTDSCLFSELKKSVHGYINKCLDEIRSEYLQSIVNCESPIEQMMAIALERMHSSYQNGIREERRGIDILDIKNQQAIVIGKIKYRVDFLIIVWLPKNNETIQFVIECDGHDFHEKTKEQAIWDKQRDRALNHNGYRVIRFTGSEIFKYPDKCADEVFDIIFDTCKGGKRHAE